MNQIRVLREQINSKKKGSRSFCILLPRYFKENKNSFEYDTHLSTLGKTVTLSFEPAENSSLSPSFKGEKVSEKLTARFDLVIDEPDSFQKVLYNRKRLQADPVFLMHKRIFSEVEIFIKSMVYFDANKMINLLHCSNPIWERLFGLENPEAADEVWSIQRELETLQSQISGSFYSSEEGSCSSCLSLTGESITTIRSSESEKAMKADEEIKKHFLNWDKKNAFSMTSFQHVKDQKRMKLSLKGKS